MCVCICLWSVWVCTMCMVFECRHIHATVHMWSSEDNFQFSPSIMWVLGIVLRSSGLYSRGFNLSNHLIGPKKIIFFQLWFRVWNERNFKTIHKFLTLVVLISRFQSRYLRVSTLPKSVSIRWSWNKMNICNSETTSSIASIVIATPSKSEGREAGINGREKVEQRLERRIFCQRFGSSASCLGKWSKQKAWFPDNPWKASEYHQPAFQPGGFLPVIVVRSEFSENSCQLVFLELSTWVISIEYRNSKENHLLQTMETLFTD